MNPFRIVLWTALLFLIRPAWADAPAPDLESPADSAELTADPADPSSAGRVARNLVALGQGQAWAAARGVGGLAVSILLGGFAGLVLGLGLAVVVTAKLHGAGAFRAPWRWHRFVGWIWPVLIVVGFALGTAYAGLWWGGGRRVKRWVERDRLIDRLVAQVVCAVAMDAADIELKGGETVDQMLRVLDDSERVAGIMREDFERAVAAMVEEDIARLRVKGRLTLYASRAVADRLADDLAGLDPRLVLVMFLAHPSLEDYLAAYPDAHPAVMAMAGQMQAIRLGAVRLVDMAVLPNLALGLFLGIASPLLLVAVFRLAVRRFPAGGRP